MLRWSIWLHKWIALIVGVQVLGWVLGGLVMTAIPIERVRGEHHSPARTPPTIDPSKVMPAAQVATLAGETELVSANLKSTPRGPIWELYSSYGGEAWYDAITGANVDEIGEAQARTWAAADYQGAGRPVKAELFYEAPLESQVAGAVWRVEFDDPERTRLYLSAYTGETLSRRSDVWRLYNLFYQVHIMNFTGGAGYNHPLIVIATSLTLAVVATGLVLLWIRLARDIGKLRRRRAG